jgi:hypothetical protein
LRRQLPVYGRLAYPVRAEATKHVLPGRKKPRPLYGIAVAVGATWEANKLGGLNITECLQPRKSFPRKVAAWIKSGKPTQPLMGKADDIGEVTGVCT